MAKYGYVRSAGFSKIIQIAVDQQVVGIYPFLDENDLGRILWG